MSDRKKTAATQILLALVPYTKQNLQLVFQPGKFFDELEHTSGYSRQTLRQTFSRLRKQGYVTSDISPRVTARGRQYVQPYIAKKLEGSVSLLVMFDIPQDQNHQRRKFRDLLRRLGFTQVQRSVWASSDDHVTVVREAVDSLEIGHWVELYEAVKID